MANIISCFGYGKTTKALAESGHTCIFYDDKVTKPFTDTEGNRVCPSHLFNPKYSTLEIPSPGIAPSHPLIQQAQHLMSDYDFYAEKMPFSIWVSGTNGKTTTTQMITHMLASRGAVCGGNIGTPVALLDVRAPIWVLETSSFTLHYTRHAHPNIYVLLPITPDHIGWHGSMEAYEHDKLKPLGQMREGEAVILPRKYAHYPTAGFKILYDNEHDLAAYFGFDLEKIAFDGVFLLDAVIALGIETILYNQSHYDTINTFVMDTHRQERIYDTLGRLWVNDSKATNIDATCAALRSFDDHPLHLILGGDDKGVDLIPLFNALEKFPSKITLYLIGSNASRLGTLAKQYHLEHVISQFLDAAVSEISRRHNSQSVALLSPAAASLDQFASYTARGDAFKAHVGALS
ncbi:MAG: UDP-N-acetylmuramoyl-L-alanine--D-glutamate ligase [Sulfurimonas sp.]|nr:MAG: UDP-N-acetylmuramoyl-L-alanine--D-glutamate ligase [Sulfurimonas sp.]